MIYRKKGEKVIIKQGGNRTKPCYLASMIKGKAIESSGKNKTGPPELIN